MKRVLLFILGCLPLILQAANNAELKPVVLDLSDKQAQASGALFYLQHCLGCHSIKYMRYEALSKDLGIPEEEVREKYIPGEQKLVDPIVSSMPAKDATKWFGTETPDLSLTARSRSPEWIYNYLHGFYLDASRPHGVNNRVFHNVAMPHVLHELQGNQILGNAGGDASLELLGDGHMSAEEYDQAITELVNFLYFVSEPHHHERLVTGRYVLIYLLLLATLCYFLKQSFWRRIH